MQGKLRSKMSHWPKIPRRYGRDGRVNIIHGLQDGDDWIPYISQGLVHLESQ